MFAGLSICCRFFCRYEHRTLYIVSNTFKVMDSRNKPLRNNTPILKTESCQLYLPILLSINKSQTGTKNLNTKAVEIISNNKLKTITGTLSCNLV